MKINALWAVCFLMVMSLACHRGNEKHSKLSKEDSARVALDDLSKQISSHEKDAGLYHARGKASISASRNKPGLERY